MQLKTLFASASLVAATVAQISQSRIAFTVLPTNVQAGNPVTLQWGGGDGSPVTITLQEGTTTNLQTIAVLTGSATGNSYVWTPSSSLPNAQDYALKIEQGDQPPNYTGMITLTGGSSSSASTSSGSASVSSTASVASSASISSSPSSGVFTPPTKNSTTGPILNANSTTTAAPVGTGVVGTGVGASGSAATGTSALRNTTLSKATLTSSTATSSSAAATTTSGSSTTSGPAPSSSSKSGAVVTVASNFALLAAAVVGVVYLG